MTDASAGQSPQTAAPRRRLSAEGALRLFLRIMSLVLLGVGIREWAVLLGALPSTAPDFFTLNTQGQAGVMFFAVANLVAAVGLWLTANWGLVIWFAVAGTRIARPILYPVAFGWSVPFVVAEGLAICLYLVLFILTVRARRREIARQRESRRSRSADQV